MSISIKKIKTIFYGLMTVTLFAFLAIPTKAAEKPNLNISDSDYQAQYVSQNISDPIEIEAGSTKTVTIKFKNTGSKTWDNSSNNFVSAYTMGPRYRDSKFASDQWLSKKQTAKISKTVRPGETGELKIKLTAPEKTGEFKEKFFLASEDNTWIKNGYFYLDIKVKLPEREPTEKEKKISNPNLKISNSAYQAQYISQSEADPIEIPAGDSKRVAVTFKNTGSATWSPRSSNFVSAYTVKPKYNESEFMSSEWISSSQSAKINQIIKPGKKGNISFKLKAPKKTGTYIEHFHLASEDNTWIKDGYFYLKIKVTGNQTASNNEKQPIQSANNNQNSTDNSQTTQAKENQSFSNNEKEKQNQSLYSGGKVFLNPNKISAPGGNKIRVIFAAENSGDNVWPNYTLKVSKKNSTSFADNSWKSKREILTSENDIGSGSIFREEFYLRTPPESGKYTFKVNLFVKGEKVSDFDLKIPVEVTKDAGPNYNPPFVDDKQVRWEEEPRIRVGLKKIENNYTLFTPKNDDYKVFKGSDIFMGTLEQGDTATLKKEKNKFTFVSDKMEFETNKYIRLKPKNNEHAKFELGHFDRKVEWKGPRNFDTYRGAFEYRLSDGEDSDLFAINDLLMEDYVKGIAETSDNPPMAMLKAQAVAARTYSQHIKTTPKHVERNFGVIAHTGDQLYLGVESEKITPRYVQAAQATRGYMMTYNDEIVVTPYFGHSNGYTSSWDQVWGGEKPWLVPVRTEYDKGLGVNGHEVGMSQRDAALRAREEALSWKELLKYYYTDIEIEQFYK